MNDDQLIQQYLAEIARTRGADIAAKTQVSHSHGWFYVWWASRVPDGKIWQHSVASCYRRKKLEQMIANLQKRSDYTHPDLTAVEMAEETP